MRSVNQILKLIPLCLLILVSTNSCRKGISDLNPVFTAQNEAELGLALHETVLQNPNVFPVLNRAQHPDVYAYLDAVANMVELQTEIRDEFDWEITVLDDDTNKNAFTLPGGKIYVTTGFLKFMHAEHQLFSLIAHESYYADRVNQNSTDELSVVMDKLKNSDKYVNNGTIVFLDVINGNPQEGIEMIEFLQNAMYEAYEVLEADEHALGMICENYLYSAYGIKEMIIEVEDMPSITTFNWFENKPPVPNTLFDPNSSVSGPFRDERVEQIDSWADLNNCGGENTTQNINAYQRFLDLLP